MKTRLNEVNDEEIIDGYLGYFSKVIPTTVITVPIDEPIRESKYYRQVVSGINELEECDEVHFKISSIGGQLAGLETLLSAVKQ